MVEARILRDSGGRITGFHITGHAGAGEFGKDIVCAAVSVLAQATVNGLIGRLDLRPEVQIRNGDMECRLPPDLRPDLAERAQDLLETMVLALRSLAAQKRYQRFIRLIESAPPQDGAC